MSNLTIELNNNTFPVVDQKLPMSYHWTLEPGRRQWRHGARLNIVEKSPCVVTRTDDGGREGHLSGGGRRPCRGREVPCLQENDDPISCPVCDLKFSWSLSVGARPSGMRRWVDGRDGSSLEWVPPTSSHPQNWSDTSSNQTEEKMWSERVPISPVNK